MLKNKFALIIAICLSGYYATAQSNFTHAGSEFVTFGSLNLSSGSGVNWGTDRLSTPGYFSAVNGTSYTGSSDTYNINGYVKKYGNEAFTFPIGSGNDLRTLSISAPSLTTDAYATAWIVGDPSVTDDPTLPNAGTHSTSSFSFPIISVSNVGQWDWQIGDAGNLGAGTTGTGAGLSITVSIPDMTSFANTGDLRLVGWDGTSWIDLSGTATASGNTENSTLSGTMVAGISAIAIGTVSPLFPIRLLSFEASPSNCDVYLSWRTKAENGIDKFIIEQSKDAVTFSPIATVTARNTFGENQYNLLAQQPQGLYYYRLKIYSNDGRFIYSRTISYKTNCTISGNIVVYPNPVMTQPIVNVSITTNYRGKVTLLMTNELGQKLMNLDENVISDKTIVPVAISRFAHGVYYISVFTSDGVRLAPAKQFIKIN